MTISESMPAVLCQHVSVRRDNLIEWLNLPLVMAHRKWKFNQPGRRVNNS